MKRSDAGFTLIELLIAIVIIGIISIPIGNAITGYLHNTNATIGRLTESHDAQISNAYFQQDAAGIGVRDYADTVTPYGFKQSVELNAPPTTGLYPCGDATLPNATVRLAWDDFTSGPSSSPIQVRASYVVESGSGQTQLHRLICAGSATVVSDTVLAHDLVSASASCITSCTGTTTNLPRSVSLTLTIHDAHSTGASNYVIVLTGQRRQT